jgi:glycosyltransferase involved in cell wall biosynthesis
MNLTLISPFHGGSHQAWAEGYQKSSAHQVTLLTLPARHWKWRMHGGAVTLARRFREQGHEPDLILATDMLDLTTFLALTRPRTARVPVALYMHENQLTYPLPEDPSTGPMRRQHGERDFHYVFINFASMLAADAVIFNSRYHRDSFFTALPKFLGRFPDHEETGRVGALEAKSHVLPVGIDLRRLDEKTPHDERGGEAPLILWNQRWEYDKNPAAFFEALYKVAGEGIPFRLALCGEQYGRQPIEFDEAQARLGERIVHAGYASAARYRQLLWEAGITVSTAHHEFFGISILEAIYCRTFPILPRRLSYPELIPEFFHEACLYRDATGLLARLKSALTQPEKTAALVAELAPAAARFDWEHVAPAYDSFTNAMGRA